jgi:hypothetical protein
MTDDEQHPDGCMCEDCKRFRERETMKECYPEEHRRLKHIRGQDSEPDPVLRKIPDGMSEREARARGYI